ncbi:cupin domain-containing protein [Williamsia sp. M5A3_1d]
MSKDSISEGTLLRLLDPVTPGEFFNSYHGLSPLHVGRKDKRYFADMPTLDDIDSILTTTVVKTDSANGQLVRTTSPDTTEKLSFPYRNDGRIDIQAVYSAYADGYTLIINCVEKRSAAVAVICRNLEAELGCRVSANIYLTPPASQGFVAHFDSHDVFIIQLSGSKNWRVGHMPYVGEREPGLARPDFLNESWKRVLNSGDTMYLPKGCPHQALTGERSSLHITFGIVPLSWSDLGVDETLVDKFPVPLTLEELMCTNDLSNSSLSKAVSGRQRAEYVSQYFDRFTSRSGHFKSLDLLAHITTDSLIERSISGTIRFRYDSGFTRIDYPGGLISLPVLPPPAVVFLKNTRRFAIKDLPGFVDDAAKIECVDTLIRGGLMHLWEDLQARESIP